MPDPSRSQCTIRKQEVQLNLMVRLTVCNVMFLFCFLPLLSCTLFQCIEITSYSVHGSIVEKIGIESLKNLALEQYLSCSILEGSVQVSGCWEGVQEFRKSLWRELADYSGLMITREMEEPQDSLSSLVSQASMNRERERRLQEGLISPGKSASSSSVTFLTHDPILTSTVLSPSSLSQSTKFSPSFTRPSPSHFTKTSLPSSTGSPHVTEGASGTFRGSTQQTSLSGSTTTTSVTSTSAPLQPFRSSATSLTGSYTSPSLVTRTTVATHTSPSGTRSLPLGGPDTATTTTPASSKTQTKLRGSKLTPVSLTSATLSAGGAAALVDGLDSGGSADRIQDLLTSDGLSKLGFTDFHLPISSSSGAGSVDVSSLLGRAKGKATDPPVSRVQMDEIGDLDPNSLYLMKKLGHCQMTGITLNFSTGSVTLTANSEAGLEAMRNAFITEYSKLNGAKIRQIKYNLLDDVEVLQSYAVECDQKYRNCAFWLDERERCVNLVSLNQEELEAAHRQLSSNMLAHQAEKSRLYGGGYRTLETTKQTPVTKATAPMTTTQSSSFTIVGMQKVSVPSTTAPSIFEAATQKPSTRTKEAKEKSPTAPESKSKDLKLSANFTTPIHAKAVHSQRERPTSEGHRGRGADTDVMFLMDGRIVFRILKENIIYEESEAIVNAANSHLKHHGGVAHDLNRASDGMLQFLSDEYIEKYGPIRTGQVAFTQGGGSLKCKFVIHAVGPRAQDYSEDECGELLKQVCHNALKVAEQLQVASVAFPSISSGIFGVKTQITSRMIVKSIAEYQFQRNSSIKEIRIVIIDDDTYQPFLEYFRKKRNHLIKKGRGTSPGRLPSNPKPENRPAKTDSRLFLDDMTRNPRDITLGRSKPKVETPSSRLVWK